MKPLEYVKLFDELENSEWPLLQKHTRQKFEDLLDIHQADELQLIIGIEGQMEEIWDWREHFNEIKELTDEANYEEEQEGEDGPIKSEVVFGFVALVEFIFDGETYKGILFQDASPAGIFIKKFKI